MRTTLSLLTSIVGLACAAWAQPAPPPFQDPLLEHFAGRWVLQGTIAGKTTTHDIAAEWVLDHLYLKIQEISREKDATGKAAYAAIVFIGWDEAGKQYSCLWLDTTGGGGLSAPAIGHGKRSGDRIEFLFKGDDGSVFHTVFAYSQSTDTWEWIMDGEEGGKLRPFARVKLTKR
jgi:hypothetical protein